MALLKLNMAKDVAEKVHAIELSKARRQLYRSSDVASATEAHRSVAGVLQFLG